MAEEVKPTRRVVYEKGDEGFEIENKQEQKLLDNETSTKELIDFVNVQIKKMDEKLLFGGDTSPSLQELDMELIKHPHVTLALTSLYEETRWSYNLAKQAYDEWHAQKFIEIRNELNTDAISRSKWFTASEIDDMIIYRNQAEYNSYKLAIQQADARMSLFRRLIDCWNQYAFQLTQLSKNSIAEANSYSIDKADRHLVC